MARTWTLEQYRERQAAPFQDQLDAIIAVMDACDVARDYAHTDATKQALHDAWNKALDAFMAAK